MDILLAATPDGGDYVLKGNDVESTSELFNQIYLAFFGGNVEQSTKRDYAIGEQRKDWWANALVFPEDATKQFNSNTERTLRNISLTSAGRIELEESMKLDLAYIQDLGKTEVSVYLISSTQINMQVIITEPTGGQPQEFSVIWDAARNQILKS